MVHFQGDYRLRFDNAIYFTGNAASRLHFDKHESINANADKNSGQRANLHSKTY